MSALALTLTLALARAEPPPVRPGLSDLAYTLGEAHALRQACRGRADGYWYARMQALLKLEAPARERRLQWVERFNTGFAAAKSAHPACDAEARAALADARARAAPLARELAR